MLKKSRTAKTADKTPMVPWAIPVIAVMIPLIFISNHLRHSIIPATKSTKPIANNSSKGRLSLSRMLRSTMPKKLMRKTLTTMIPTKMRKPPNATATLLRNFVTCNIISSSHILNSLNYSISLYPRCLVKWLPIPLKALYIHPS
jgi:hypothetical protein